jgi:hypothetical protein
VALAALFVVLVGCGQADLSGVGGGQIIEFDNDLRQQVTVLYCPQQGCSRPISHRVAPGRSWRTANETINDSGAVALRVGGRIKGCRLIPAVGVLVDPLLVLQASYILGNPGCVRPG